MISVHSLSTIFQVLSIVWRSKFRYDFISVVGVVFQSQHYTRINFFKNNWKIINIGLLSRTWCKGGSIEIVTFLVSSKLELGSHLEFLVQKEDASLMLWCILLDFSFGVTLV